jgi:DNA (cytosine-5)-methyltransferase 1
MLNSLPLDLHAQVSKRRCIPKRENRLTKRLGFSLLQQNILSETSLKNASHITTFCSAVDTYRPQYAVLENVVSMAYRRKGFEEQNVLSQLVACLVGLGYQVNQYIMDSWSYGSGQHRCRIILAIAAPGLEPIAKPWHTHSTPSGNTIGRSLGELPNGQRFGQREQYATPFAYLSASTITSDLPDIGNGNVKTCISYPDHRVSHSPGPKERALLKCIPRYPPGCGYKEAHRRGLIPPSLQNSKKETGTAYRRIKKFGLVPTITTNLNMQDSRNGGILHWSQDRPITILDARRAQGYPDEEPVIGNLIDQYRIVGNGVDRKVSFALGRALYQSTVKNTQKHDAVGALRETIEEILVDAEVDADNVEDVVSVSSVKHKHVPQQKDVATALSTSTTRFEQQLTSKEISIHTDKYAATIQSLDGTLVATDLSRPLRLWPCTSMTFSTMSQDLVQRPKKILAEPEIVSSHSKRSPDGKEIDSRKRTKTSNAALTSAFLQDEKHLPEDDRIKIRTRYTRHSGLKIEFTPRQWNKLPEREQVGSISRGRAV